MKKSIVLLEDDEILAESLCELLEMEGYVLTHVSNGEELFDRVYEEHFDIYIFDVDLPDINGFEILKSLREYGDTTPTIFLTALSDIASLAKGFEVGADDYVKKPFDFDELLIRIGALLKKRGKSANKASYADFVYDFDKDELYKGEHFIALSAQEQKLCRLFFENKERTLSKEYIAQYLYNGKEISDGSLRVYINKLRKLNLPITTIKGVGYRFGQS